MSNEQYLVRKPPLYPAELRGGSGYLAYAQRVWESCLGFRSRFRPCACRCRARQLPRPDWPFMTRAMPAYRPGNLQWANSTATARHGGKWSSTPLVRERPTVQSCPSAPLYPLISLSFREGLLWTTEPTRHRATEFSQNKTAFPREARGDVRAMF